MDIVLIVVHTLTLTLTVVDSGYVKMRLLNAVTGSITLSLIDMQFLGSFSLKNNILTCIRSRNAKGFSKYYIRSDFFLFFTYTKFFQVVAVSKSQANQVSNELLTCSFFFVLYIT